MDYKEAKKTLQASKQKENFLLVDLGGDHKVVFPYKEGIAFVSAFASAESLKDGWREKGHILPIEPGIIRTAILSAQEYERRKIATLLDVTHDEVKALEDQKPT